MNSLKRISIFIMSFLYVYIGIQHFVNLEYFIILVPDYIKWKKLAVLISGLAEIILGILLLFKFSRNFAGILIILLLISVFPANLYLYYSDIPRESLNITKSQALFRIPFQIPLIIIAYWHSQKSTSNRFSIFCILIFIPTIIYFLSI